MPHETHGCVYSQYLISYNDAPDSEYKNPSELVFPFYYERYIDYLKQDYGNAHNDFVNRVVQSVRELNEQGIQESIVVGFNVFADRIRDSKNADIIAALENSPDAILLRKAIRVTDDPNAPAFRVEPDLPPLRYADLRLKAKEKKPDIVFNSLFNAAMRKVKADPKLCQANYLDPHKKAGQKKRILFHRSR